ncbi:uncharacterized protein METZ01_LOCUS303715 [marine metagenome]|uniref:Uncharacterized protein n=1 Tax=marine metagenome TaxID=408172 RepID=A0A382MU36_9ZZZZ
MIPNRYLPLSDVFEFHEPFKKTSRLINLSTVAVGSLIFCFKNKSGNHE